MSLYTYTHMADCTYMCQCIWRDLMHTGVELQASTFLKSLEIPAPSHFTLLWTLAGLAESGVFKKRKHTAVNKQRHNNRTKLCAKAKVRELSIHPSMERMEVRELNTAKLESRKLLTPRCEKTHSLKSLKYGKGHPVRTLANESVRCPLPRSERGLLSTL